MPDLTAEEYWKAWAAIKQRQGRMHEDAALETIGGDAASLDDFVSEHANDAASGEGARHFQGGRYPTYDITSSTEIASVKAYTSGGSEPSKQDIDNYMNAFNQTRGFGGRGYARGLSPVEQDVEAIKQVQAQGAPVPQELVGKSDAEIQKYLENETVMRIPSDHVERMRQEFSAKVRDFPQDHGLPENATDAEIQAYAAKRWQSSGLSAEETQQRLQAEGLLAEEGAEAAKGTVEEQARGATEGHTAHEAAPAQDADAAEEADVAQDEQESSQKAKGYGMGL